MSTNSSLGKESALSNGIDFLVRVDWRRRVILGTARSSEK